jgi:hypothetical protein
VLRTVLLFALATLVATACSGADLNPVEQDEERAGITIRVVGCELDPGTGIVTMTYEVESEREYQAVVINGSVKDESGVVVATSSGSVTDVSPGETYRDEMVLSPAGEPQGELDCEATLELATEPFGG